MQHYLPYFSGATKWDPCLNRPWPPQQWGWRLIQPTCQLWPPYLKAQIFETHFRWYFHTNSCTTIIRGNHAFLVLCLSLICLGNCLSHLMDVPDDRLQFVKSLFNYGRQDVCEIHATLKGLDKKTWNLKNGKMLGTNIVTFPNIREAIFSWFKQLTFYTDCLMVFIYYHSSSPSRRVLCSVLGVGKPLTSIMRPGLLANIYLIIFSCFFFDKSSRHSISKTVSFGLGFSMKKQPKASLVRSNSIQNSSANEKC